jgi:hypothetical protein
MECHTGGYTCPRCFTSYDIHGIHRQFLDGSFRTIKKEERTSKVEIIIRKMFQVWIDTGMFYYDFVYFMYELSDTIELHLEADIKMGFGSETDPVKFVDTFSLTLPKIDAVPKLGTNLRIIPDIETAYIDVPWDFELSDKIENMFLYAYRSSEHSEHYARLKEIKESFYGCILSYSASVEIPKLGGCREMEELMKDYAVAYDKLIEEEKQWTEESIKTVFST